MNIYKHDGPRMSVKIQEFINLVILSFVCRVERNLLYGSCLKIEGSWRRPGLRFPPGDQFIIRLGHLLSSTRTRCACYCNVLSRLSKVLFFSLKTSFLTFIYILHIYIYILYVYTHLSFLQRLNWRKYSVTNSRIRFLNIE